MPAKKKDAISADVGFNAAAAMLGRKSGNPDFVSSSFYVPKKINLRFNNAINTLKAEGYEIDRSDLLTVFMDRFATAVRQCEDAGEEMDLQAILGTATEEGSQDVAGVSAYKQQYRSSLEALKLASDIEMEKIRLIMEKTNNLQEKAGTAHIPGRPSPVTENTDVSNEAIAKLKASYTSVIEQMMKFVPDHEDQQIVEDFLRTMKD